MFAGQQPGLARGTGRAVMPHTQLVQFTPAASAWPVPEQCMLSHPILAVVTECARGSHATGGHGGRQGEPLEWH